MEFLSQYCLSSSGDRRDRKEEIEQMLQKWGVCILGVGRFFVSGIQMPDRSCLSGMGVATEIVLDESVEEGYAVRMGSFCSVKDLCLSGSVEELPRPEKVGTRHGIGFIGNAVTSKDGAFQPKDGIVEACRIQSFSGGGITCTDTGYSADSSLCVSNCRIHNCGAGINISHFSEYHKFTNVIATRNFYGCINNGGNNVFVGCSFDGNTAGYLIDNSEKQSKNNAHGSCVGCTFNHSDSNLGVGIRILGSAAGYVFSACQVFYSKIITEESQGLQFNGLNFGKNIEIIVKGGGAVRFDSCMFSTVPTVSVEKNDRVVFHECSTKGGTPIRFPLLEKSE